MIQADIYISTNTSLTPDPCAMVNFSNAYVKQLVFSNKKTHCKIRFNLTKICIKIQPGQNNNKCEGFK